MTRSKFPSAEPLFGSLIVGDAMQHGIVGCAPTDGLREIAAALAENRIHSVVVVDPAGGDGGRPIWGIMSDTALLRDMRSPIGLTAGNLSAAPVVTASPRDGLEHAAQLMNENEIAHLLVVDDGRPTGVISTLDIAAAVAESAEAVA